MVEEKGEGFWKECPRCKGKGTEMKDVATGLLSSERREVPCGFCGGEKRIFFTLICSRMSLGEVYLEGTNIIRGRSHTKCIGQHCHLWDHEHGGGCLERKALIAAVHGRGL